MKKVNKPPQFTVTSLLILAAAIGVLMGLGRVATDTYLAPVYNHFAFHLGMFVGGGTFGGVLGGLLGSGRYRAITGILGGTAAVALVYALAIMFAVSRSISH